MNAKTIAWLDRLSAWRRDERFAERAADMRAGVVAGLRELIHETDADRITSDEVNDLVRHYRRLYGISSDEAKQDLLADDTAEPAPTPKPMPAAAPLPLSTDSFLARYVHWLQDQEAPAPYHAFGFLTTYAAAMRRRGFFRIGALPVYPNLYTILFGPSGSRKDSAYDYAVSVVENAVGDDLHVIGHEGSPQGIVSALQERHRLIGTSDGLLPALELKVLFGRDKYKEALAEWLTDWFKSQDYWSRMLRNERVELYDVFVCLFGGSTIDWLLTMPTSVLTGGFLLGRALPIVAHDKAHWRWSPTVDADEYRRIVSDVGASMLDLPGEYFFDAAADGYMRDWYEGELPRLYAGADPRRRTFLQRAHVYAIKFAMLLGQLRGAGQALPLPVAEEAVALVNWAFESFEPFIDQLDTREPIYGDVVAKIHELGGAAPASTVARKLKNKYRAGLIYQALEELRRDGTLRKRHSVAGESYAIA